MRVKGRDIDLSPDLKMNFKNLKQTLTQNGGANR